MLLVFKCEFEILNKPKEPQPARIGHDSLQAMSGASLLNLSQVVVEPLDRI